VIDKIASRDAVIFLMQISLYIFSKIASGKDTHASEKPLIKRRLNSLS